ncbi:MAG: glycosyltransferase [Micromonosporaceae bacterium]|nr:glycosyltransferase [Micromonosporaceae bacterium]
MTRSSVTIVIPVWNAAETTKTCLAALRVTLAPDDQVVVVDNGSQDETPGLLAAQPWIDVVTHEENRGFAAGCNAGAALARHPIVIFLNNDTIPTQGWIEGLIAPFTDPGVGATGPMSNFVSGPQLIEDPAYQPRTIEDIAAYADGLRLRAAGRTSETTRLVGFCLAVRTSVFSELGGFDESFGVGGCEDDDLCHRIRFAGWRLLIVEDTFVHHLGHQTFQVNDVDWFALQEENLDRLRAKLAGTPPVSFVVLCGREPVPLIATLVGIQDTMGSLPYDVVLLVADRESIEEVLVGVGGACVVDVPPGLPEERVWQIGHHTAKGLRRAMIRAGEAVHVDALQRLLDADPRTTLPVSIGAVMPSSPETAELTAPTRPTAPPQVPRAAAEAPDPKVLYLDLMQRCLLNTIYEDPAQDPWSERRFDPAKRAGGLDWPSQAHTMIGERRMANLRFAVETVLAGGVPGDLIETGVWRGGACIYMRAILRAYGVTDRRVFVADSFEGLPPPDPEKYPADAGDRHYTYTPLAVSLDEVRSNFAKYDLLDDQVVFLKGWFKDTLPAAPVDRLAVLRMDGDMYESTMDALGALYDKVVAGGFVIVDDYALPGCRKAVGDFRRDHGITEAIIPIDQMGAYWRIQR